MATPPTTGGARAPADSTALSDEQVLVQVPRPRGRPKGSKNKNRYPNEFPVRMSEIPSTAPVTPPAPPSLDVDADDHDAEYQRKLQARIEAKKSGRPVGWGDIRDEDRYEAVKAIYRPITHVKVSITKTMRVARGESDVDELLPLEEYVGQITYAQAPSWEALHDYIAAKFDKKGDGGVYRILIKDHRGTFTYATLKLPYDPDRPLRAQREVEERRRVEEQRRLEEPPEPPPMRRLEALEEADAEEPFSPRGAPAYRWPAQQGYAPHPSAFASQEIDMPRSMPLPDGAKWVHVSDLTPEHRKISGLSSPFGPEYVAAIRLPSAPAAVAAPPAAPAAASAPMGGGEALPLPEDCIYAPKGRVPEGFREFSKYWPGMPAGFVVAIREPTPQPLPAPAAPAPAPSAPIVMPAQPAAPVAPPDPIREKLGKLTESVVETTVKKVEETVKGALSGAPAEGGEKAATAASATAAEPEKSPVFFRETPLWRTSVDPDTGKPKKMESLADLAEEVFNNLDNLKSIGGMLSDKQKEMRLAAVEALEREAAAARSYADSMAALKALGADPRDLQRAATSAPSQASTPQQPRPPARPAGGGPGIMGALKKG